jgi:cell division protein YceG involved in septum cleavage
MGKRAGYWLAAGILAASAVFMGTLLGYGALGTSIDTDGAAVVEVRAGESFRALTGRLAREGTLRHSRLLVLLALTRGDTGRIKAGDYVFHGRVSPMAFLDALVSGKGAFLVLTVPEGFSLKDIAARLEEDGLGNGQEFLRLAGDPAFIASLNLPIQPAPPTLEGLIFPETYYLYRGVREAHLIQAMVRQFKQRAWPVLNEGRNPEAAVPASSRRTAGLPAPRADLYSPRGGSIAPGGAVAVEPRGGVAVEPRGGVVVGPRASAQPARPTRQARQARPAQPAQPPGPALTPYQTLILASIVEKETGLDAERPLVSAVFLNRLRRGIKLDSDPTVIYGVPDFDGNLTRIHLRTPTPFNTYSHPGLPPTPIANPGLASIQAALAPAPVDYLYFVSRGDGTHQFSTDYRTHEKAVDRYQRHLKRGA